MPSPSAAPGSTVALRRVAQIAVVVSDIARATAFYRDTLGLRLLFEAPPSLAFFDCGGVRLMLGPAEGLDAAGASSIIYYDVADIQGTHVTLAGRGVHFDEPPRVIAPMGDRDLWLAAFRDSEGNRLALMSEVVRAAAG